MLLTFCTAIWSTWASLTVRPMLVGHLLGDLSLDQAGHDARAQVGEPELRRTRVSVSR